jgi:hypothetical protein
MRETTGRPLYLDVIEGLIEAGIGHTVVDGVAIVPHGAPRMTGDLDLAVLLETENLLSFISATARLGYRSRVPADPRGVADPSVRNRWKTEKSIEDRLRRLEEAKEFIFTAMPPENRVIFEAMRKRKPEE